MKRRNYRFSAIILALVLLLGIPFVASAEIPYESYNYWSEVSANKKSVYNRPMYTPDFTLDAKDLGVAEFTKINDINVDKEGNLYLLDSESRIVVLNKDYQLVREIGLINGKEAYKEASGIFVYGDGTLYICDTEGHRVMHITNTGELLETIVLPESPLIPDDFEFRPTKIVVDDDNYLYVLSDGSYYGALIYAPDKTFKGFYGANAVTGSLSTVLTNIMNRIFPNNEKKGNTAQRLPYCFVDIDIDNEGFIYTCNGFTELYGKTGQIRKLSPGFGKNILKSENENFVDEDINKTYSDGIMSKQNISDIAVDSNGFVYGLESTFGKIFFYDSNNRTLSVFGGGMGVGTQEGTFKSASGLTIKNDGNEVIVSDSGTNKITVFKITEFGSKAKGLLDLTLRGKYEEAKSGWEELLKLDNNFQPAYSGLARAYLDEGDYKAAMDLAKEGYDRETYAVAYEYYRTDLISDNFVWIFIALIVVVAGAITFLVISSKKKLVFIKNKQVNMMFSVMTHPANTFTDIKEKGFGSILLCIITVILFYVATVLQTLAGGFLFSVYDSASFNSLWVLVQTVGLVVLWIAADWLVCTLLGGKGKLKEITIITCYSLWPLIIEKFIRLILTNTLLPSEASFLSILDTIAILYFLFLMIIGLLKIHDFSMARLVGTSALAIVGMAAIIFLIILIAILVQQFGGFIVTLISEIKTL